MRRHMLGRKITVLICLLIAGFGLVFYPVSAQDSPGGSGLQIAPTRTDVSIVAGEERDANISVKNVTQGNLTVQTFINDFESDNVTGNPRLLVDTSKRTPYTLANMVTGLSNFDLKPNESKEVKLSIKVPADASPGAYFSAIRFAAIPKTAAGETPGENEQQVALTASLAHLMFVEVPGEINEQIQIESLKIQNGDKSGTVFFSSPNKAALAIKNLGNGFSRPFGQVSVKRFGKEVYSYEINKADPKAIVLPNSSRTLTDELKNIKSPGRYTAVALVAYGNGAEVISAQVSFWYIPSWTVILFFVLLLAIAGGGYVLYRKRFGRNKKSRR